MNYIYFCMNMIHRSDKVLDVGGCYQPFHRADSVIDFFPYYGRREDNAFYKDMKPHYSKETWFAQDICDHNKRWPFKDKEFDYVVCSQTLEDVRDPLYVCEEMQRVGKRGFIETPSRFYEQTDGMEMKGLSGASHHRWILTIEDGTLVFHFKSHDIHKHGLKPPFFNRYPFLNPQYETMGAIWQGSFKALEDIQTCIRNDGSFYEETEAIAKKLGRVLWDQSEKLPLGLEWNTRVEWFNGIKSVIDLKDIWNPYRLYHSNLDRSRSQESLKYELLIK